MSVNLDLIFYKLSLLLYVQTLVAINRFSKKKITEQNKIESDFNELFIKITRLKIVCASVMFQRKPHVQVYTLKHSKSNLQ